MVSDAISASSATAVPVTAPKIRSSRLPFTSSYLPGSRPPIQTVCIYGAAVNAYVLILSGLIVTSVEKPYYYLIAFGLAMAVWARVRKQRLEHWQVGTLEYEELAEPAVQTLAIYRD